MSDTTFIPGRFNRSATRTDPITDWPTAMRTRLTDGRLIGTDNSVWLYRAVPLGPVVDAAHPADALHVAEPIIAACEELAAMTSYKVARRTAARSNYRHIHLLLVNLPQLFEPPLNHPLRDHLIEHLGDQHTERRILLFGVRLRDQIGSGGGLRAAVDSVVETLMSGSTPLSDYDADRDAVDAALARSGMRNVSADELRVVNSWWNRGTFPDTPLLVHGDHMHVCSTVDAARTAAAAGDDCSLWPQIDNQHAITFASVQDFDLPFVPATSAASWWASRLVNSGARAISIRGQLEPSPVTRQELRRRRKQFIDDINERFDAGKMERAEQEELLGQLTDVEAAYAAGGPPTLVDTSVVVGLDGLVGDIDELGRSAGVVLNAMLFRQQAAWAETLVCSPVRANPHRHDLPVTTVAYSGLPSLSAVGDPDGALVGFTERDRQPAWLSPTAAARADSLPISLVAGATGSGKSIAMLYLADQFARSGRPVVIVDPKLGSNHDTAVQLSGGQVASLDNLAQSDGVFDPLRFAASKEAGVEMAASMLLSVNPWGSRRDDFETPLIRALSVGVQHGATCIGEALRIAYDAGQAPEEMVRRVFDLAEASPMFRACVGMQPGTTALRVAEGITLIKVGNAHLDLPESAAGPMSQQQRVALALVRMMVMGSAMALTGRQGVVMLDEAWVFLGAGRSEVERLGRLARSQGVLPMMFTQRVTDAVDAGLTGYISRGLILPIQDTEEAYAACTLFGLEPTPERLNRITARGTMGASDGTPGAPNWASMRALRDPSTGETLRGSIAIYSDLSGRAVPVEIVIPQSFLERASTNPDDIARREQAPFGELTTGN